MICDKCPKKGDLVFTRSDSLISRAIRFITGSKFSHVAVYVGNGLVLESDWSGVVVSSLRKFSYSGGYYEVVSVCLSAEERERFVSALYEKIGDSYDYSLLLCNFFQRMVHGPLDIIRSANRPNRWLCSEVVAYALRAIGEDVDPDLSLPDDLYKKYAVAESCRCSTTAPINHLGRVDPS